MHNKLIRSEQFYQAPMPLTIYNSTDGIGDVVDGINNPPYTNPCSLVVTTPINVAEIIISDQSLSDSESQSAYTLPDSDSISVSSPADSDKPSLRRRKRKRELAANNIIFTENERGRVMPRLIVPHFVKLDGRRNYAQMVAHVYNSCDYNLTSRFMKSYFRQDFTVVQELGGNLPFSMQGKVEIYGLEANCQYWYERMMDYPDVVFTLKSVELKVNSDEDGLILADFEMSASIVQNAPTVVTKATAILDADSPDQTFVLGQPEIVYGHQDTTMLRGATEHDFDAVFSERKVPDLGLEGGEELGTLLQSNDLIDADDLDTLAQCLPNKASRSAKSASLRRTETGLDPAERELLESQRMVLMNQPAKDCTDIQTTRMVIRGNMRMHFDSDGRLFLNEFNLFF